jgi:hypothetical protein
MAVSEPDRHDLDRGLEALGKRRAETFMNLVTSVPWTEVATKRDVAELRAELSEIRASRKQDIADLRAEMHRALRLQLLSFITVVAVFNGMTVAALRLL